MEKLTAVGSVIGALELIARSQDLDDKGIFSWPLHRTLHPSRGRFPKKQLFGLLEYPNVVAVHYARLLAAGRLLLGDPGQPERALVLGVLTASIAGMNTRHRYGSDDSDQMAQATFMASLPARAFPNDSRARKACLRFVAFQACVSYASAGTVKLVSPMWRNGSAVTGIFRTQSYGDATIHALLKLEAARVRARGDPASPCPAGDADGHRTHQRLATGFGPAITARATDESSLASRLRKPPAESLSGSENIRVTMFEPRVGY